MSGYAGVLVTIVIASAIASVLALFHLRVAPRRPNGRSSTDDVEPHAPPDVQRSLARFHFLAVTVLAYALFALLLLPWAASFVAFGSHGLGVAFAFAVPLLVGFVYGRARGGLDE